jgi:nucleoside-diphosphate-sugar epimerase
VAARRVLITGAAGFIGGACLREFLARGWEAVALVHRRTGPELAALARAGRVGLVRGSIVDGAGLLTALAAEHDRLDAVVHAAGRASDVGRGREFRASHLVGTQSVVRCVRELAIRRLIHISTTDVYGLHDFRSADESTPLETRPVNPYPKYKILAELEIARELPAGRYAILRPGAVWGAGDRTILPRVIGYLRAMPFIIHFGRWRGCNRWPLAHVGNVARAALAAAEEEQVSGQAYNVVDRETVSIDEYYRMLAAAFLPGMRRLRSVTLPGWLGAGLGRISTGLSWLLNRDRPVFEPSLYGLQSVSRHLDFSGRSFEALLSRHGLRPVERDAAIEDLRRWVCSGS